MNRNAFKLLVKNAKQIAVVCNGNQRVLRGAEMSRVEVLEAEGGGGVSIIVDLYVSISSVSVCHCTSCRSPCLSLTTTSMGGLDEE